MKYYNLKYQFFIFILMDFQNVTYSWDGKAEFSAAITSIFSVTRSFRNHFNMLIHCFAAQEALLSMFKAVTA